MLVNQYKSIQEFVNTLSDEIKGDAPSNTGNLRKSIEGDYVEVTNGFEISFIGTDYASFQDLGVNGTENNYGSPYTFSKRPPISSVEGFANKYGINPYALATSIMKKGIRPKMFITNNVNQNIDEFADDYREALWVDYYKEDLKHKPKQTKK